MNKFELKVGASIAAVILIFSIIRVQAIQMNRLKALEDKIIKLNDHSIFLERAIIGHAGRITKLESTPRESKAIPIPTLPRNYTKKREKIVGQPYHYWDCL